MHIVQLAPSIGPGSGVAGVANNLEREFLAMGHRAEQFTLVTAGWRRRRWPRRRLLRALTAFRRMVWFDSVGTRRARRFLADRPGAVSICHNGLLVGDIYVNHGVVTAAMRARGHGMFRILRNPTHPYSFVRDLIRYRSGIHRAVVALSTDEPANLRRTYGKIRPPIDVIPNGVDTEAFRPPTPTERLAARQAFALDDEARVALFIGYEFGRKGIHLAIEALVHAPTVLLLVAGGNSSEAIVDATAHARRAGVDERVLLLGPRTDLALFFAASDIFVLPSYYEANALVVLEALASGLPVVATRVGAAAELVCNGENGYLVGHDAVEIADRLEHLAAQDLSAWRERARASVEAYSWTGVARRYLALAERVAAEREQDGARPAKSRGV